MVARRDETGLQPGLGLRQPAQRARPTHQAQMALS